MIKMRREEARKRREGVIIFFFKQKTAYEISACLVGSEMCIRDRVYSLTPRGVARKARLTYEFMKYSLDFYRDARQHLRRSLSIAVARQKTVAIFGTGDAAELGFLLVRDMGLELTAGFGPEGNGRFLGLPVLPFAEQASVTYDVLIVAVLERPAGTARLLRQSGVPDEKILMLQPQPETHTTST